MSLVLVSRKSGKDEDLLGSNFSHLTSQCGNTKGQCGSYTTSFTHSNTNHTNDNYNASTNSKSRVVDHHLPVLYKFSDLHNCNNYYTSKYQWNFNKNREVRGKRKADAAQQVSIARR